MTGVVIDTSVWIEHFRRPSIALRDLITNDLALMHPFVLVELACGTPPAPRARTLHYLSLLPEARPAPLAAVTELIEREALFGSGCGLVDMSLLTSTLMTPGARLCTRDKRLSVLAKRFAVLH